MWDKRATTLYALIRSAIDTDPERTFMVFPDESLTYGDFDQRLQLARRSLLALGVRRGGCVGLLMHNCADFFALLFGAVSIGAVALPINNRNRAVELAYVIADSQADLVVTSRLGGEITDLEGRLTAAFDHLHDAVPPPRIVLDHGNGLGLLTSEEIRVAAAAVDEVELDRRTQEVATDDPAIMIYTSGTTAHPKGCPLLHRQLLSIGAQTGERWGTREGDAIWNALPCFHMSSILPLLACVFARGTWLSSPVFNASDAIRMMRDYRADLAWPAFGTVWQDILVHPEFTAEAISSVRAVLAVAPPETTHVLEHAAPHVSLLSCYGITEGIGVPIMVRHDDPHDVRTTTSGLPFDGIEVQIRDPDTREEVVRGVRGVIWLRGPNVFGGYWHDPASTAKAFDADGWFDTGDLGDMSDNGVIRYLGRLKDMLKVGGENVAAIEIEEHLSTHPAVKLAAVVGAPDAKYGEVPAAYIELRPGSQATDEEIIEFCRGRIASFKIPRYVRFVTEWPMSATKIRKVELRDAIAADLSASMA